MRLWLVTFLLSFCLLPQALAADVLGWQNTRWGMTEQQAAAALGGDGRRVTPPEQYQGAYAPLKTTMNIAGHEIEALLQFSNQTKTFEQVLLKSSAGGLNVWAKLRDLLTEKYGPPAQVGDSREWRFKTTIIELSRLFIPGVVDQVSIRYYPASEYKDEKRKL